MAGGTDAGRRRSRRSSIEEPALCAATRRASSRGSASARPRPRSRERLAALGAGLDQRPGRRDEPRPLGHRPAAPRLRPRHAREGRGRPSRRSSSAGRAPGRSSSRSTASSGRSRRSTSSSPTPRSPSRSRGSWAVSTPRSREKTTRVLLESAHFDPGVVRRTARGSSGCTRTPRTASSAGPTPRRRSTGSTAPPRLDRRGRRRDGREGRDRRPAAAPKPRGRWPSGFARLDAFLGDADSAGALRRDPRAARLRAEEGRRAASSSPSRPGASTSLSKRTSSRRSSGARGTTASPRRSRGPSSRPGSIAPSPSRTASATSSRPTG